MIQHAFDRVRRGRNVVASLDAGERRRDQHHHDRDDSDDDQYFEQRKSAFAQGYGATRAAYAVALRSRNYKAGSRRLRNRRTQTGKRRAEIGQQRKSEALTQLWQRKNAKALTLSQRENTARGERRHKLKRTTKPGNCESLNRSFVVFC